MKPGGAGRYIAAAAAFLLVGCGGDALVAPPEPDVNAAAFDDPEIAADFPDGADGCPDQPRALINEVFDVAIETVPLYDPSRDRSVAVDVFLPAGRTDVAVPGSPPVFGSGPYSVVVFSHGGYLIDYSQYTADDFLIFPEFTAFWTSKGYVVLAPRHQNTAPSSSVSDTQGDRVRDVRFALDHAQELVRAVAPSVFVDLRYPVVAGFSTGATTAALVGGMKLHDVDLGYAPDFSDPRFEGVITLTGVPASIAGLDWWDPDWSGLTMPVLSAVGSEDLNNEPGTVPEDFLDIVRLSPPGGKHGVMVVGAGHFLGARPSDDPGTLDVSQTATALFLRAYATPPNDAAVATLSHASFCQLVRSRQVEVEVHERPFIPGGWPQ